MQFLFIEFFRLSLSRSAPLFLLLIHASANVKTFFLNMNGTAVIIRFICTCVLIFVKHGAMTSIERIRARLHINAVDKKKKERERERERYRRSRGERVMADNK